MKRSLNQKLINLIEYYNLANINILLSNLPLKRNIKNLSTAFVGTKSQKLDKLRKTIQLIKNCELTEHEAVEIVNIRPTSMAELRSFTFGWKKLILAETLEKMLKIIQGHS